MTHIDDQGHVVVDVTRADGSHEDIVWGAWMPTELATDSKVVELCERAQTALPESLNWVWHDCYDSYDPWGSAMSNAFALNDIAYERGWETDPTYSASPFGADTEDNYYQMYTESEPTREDVEGAIKVFSTLLHALELLGLSY